MVASHTRGLPRTGCALVQPGLLGGPRRGARGGLRMPAGRTWAAWCAVHSAISLQIWRSRHVPTTSTALFAGPSPRAAAWPSSPTSEPPRWLGKKEAPRAGDRVRRLRGERVSGLAAAPESRTLGDGHRER